MFYFFLPSTCHLITQLGESHYLKNCYVTIDESINQREIVYSAFHPLRKKNYFSESDSRAKYHLRIRPSVSGEMF